jgi:hypothetical protein
MIGTEVEGNAGQDNEDSQNDPSGDHVDSGCGIEVTITSVHSTRCAARLCLLFWKRPGNFLLNGQELVQLKGD